MDHISQTARTVHIGRHLAYSLRNKPAAQRAALAAEDSDGDLYICQPTKAQRASVFRVSPRSLAAALALPPKERDRVKHGLRKLVEPQDRVKAVVRGINTDADVERLIVEIGLDRIFNTIDRLTRPAIQAAE